MVNFYDLDSHSKEVKTATDKFLAEAIKLMGNDVDSRRINLFDTKKLEVPVFCKKTLDNEELIKLSQRATNMSFCWINSTGISNLGKHTYLDFPYLDQNQFATFYACAT